MTTKPVPPVYTAGRFSKDDVAKFLGRVNVPNTKPEKRKIQPMEAGTTHMKCTEKQLKQITDKTDLKQKLSLSSGVTNVNVLNTKPETYGGSDFTHEIYRETVRATQREIRRETNTVSVFLCY